MYKGKKSLALRRCTWMPLLPFRPIMIVIKQYGNHTLGRSHALQGGQFKSVVQQLRPEEVLSKGEGNLE